MSSLTRRSDSWVPKLLIRAALCCIAVPAAADLGDKTPAIDPQQIEAEGTVIGQVIIDPKNIFDLDNPLENKWLYRTMNRFHVVTKPKTIERHLLFEAGDPYSKRLSDESERIIRSNGYINDVDITPVNYADGKVDLLVESHDVWTLSPDITLGRSGGENKYGFGILEENLFGRGQQIGISFVSDVDRDTIGLEFSDNNFRGQRRRIAIAVDDSTDGHQYRFVYAKPFYALDTKSAGGASFLDGERIDQLYDRGDVVTEFNNEYRHHEAFIGWSEGLNNSGWATRFTAGVAYEENRFEEIPGSPYPLVVVPEDREFIYPFVGMQLVKDHYETTVNFDQIFRTEDRHLGLNLGFRIGYSNDSVGSSKSAWHVSGGMTNSLISTQLTSLDVLLSFNGRFESGVGENVLLSGGARYHRRLSERTLFFSSISGTVSDNLDLDNPIQLGGDSGLRGYPLRYQTGESKGLLTAEYRYYTDWYLFRMLHVGGAVFFDIGRTWGESPVGGVNLGWLRDAGVGLRLGKTRMGGGVVHIDLAFPLDGEDDIDSVQLLFKVKKSF
jgi:outer membrane protein assembly factor BamA